MLVRVQVPVDELVAEVERRARFKLLLPFLESALDSGSQDATVYNALAKIYIDSNNPEKFLKENMLYDSLIVGKYCAKRDPYLAFIAYQKGQNDAELVHITNENQMFKHQAQYLVKRRNLELWASVLQEGIYRRLLIDQVLLEKIIIEPSPFSENQHLQNFLILSAIKANPVRVRDYIEKLDNYDAPEIANIAINSGLHEKAFEIYKKTQSHGHAIHVLIEHIVSIDRAAIFAESVDTLEVWSRLGKAQLDDLRIKDSIGITLRGQADM